MARNGSGTYNPPTNSWNPAVNGVSATAVDWQSILNDLSAALTQSVSRDGQAAMTGNLPMGGNKLTGLAAGTGTGDSLRFEQLFDQGIEQDVASAATTDIGIINSNFIRITGTTTITSFGTNYKGPRFVRFAGALILTHNATTLVLPTSANITTAAGDRAIIAPIGNPASGWQVLAYQRADGTLINPVGITVTSLNGGQLAGVRNKIINGDFRINQRVYVSGAATTAGQYTLDRWKVTGTGGITFATVNNKTTVTIPSGQTFQQVIEGLNLQTGTYVLSWEGTAQGRINGGSYGASGTVTTSLTGGSNATVEFNTGTVANVQIELGTVATPFEQRLIGQEIGFCARYLPVWIVPESSYIAQGQCFSTTQAIFTLPHQVQARAAVTGVTVISGTFAVLTANATQQALTSLAINTGGVQATTLVATATAATLVAGNASSLICTSGTGVIVGNGVEL